MSAFDRKVDIRVPLQLPQVKLLPCPPAEGEHETARIYCIGWRRSSVPARCPRTAGERANSSDCARGAVVTTFPSTLNQRTDHGDGGPLVLGAQPSGPPLPGSVTLVTVPGRFALYSAVNSP